MNARDWARVPLVLWVLLGASALLLVASLTGGGTGALGLMAEPLWVWLLVPLLLAGALFTAAWSEGT